MKENDTKEHYIRKIFEPFLKSSASYEKDYIEKRLIEQIIWYDKSAIKKQKRYKHLCRNILYKNKLEIVVIIQVLASS